jgi:YesN/AraC family two-component response regulator
MRPRMNLLYSMVQVQIPSGFLPRLADETSDPFAQDEYEDNLEIQCPSQSFMELIDQVGERPDAFCMVDIMIKQNVHKFYIFICSGRYIQARKLFEDLFEPVFMEENLTNVLHNALFVFFDMNYYILEKTSLFRQIFNAALPVPERLGAVRSKQQMWGILIEYYESVISIYQKLEPRANPIVDRILEMIETGYSQPLTMESVASKLHLTPSYASRLFKENVGVNFKWYLNEVRMDATYNLLKRTDIPIQEIAERVGYKEMRGFYKMFRNHFGTTCTQIRQLYTSKSGLNN